MDTMYADWILSMRAAEQGIEVTHCFAGGFPEGRLTVSFFVQALGDERPEADLVDLADSGDGQLGQHFQAFGEFITGNLPLLEQKII